MINDKLKLRFSCSLRKKMLKFPEEGTRNFVALIEELASIASRLFQKNI